MTKEKLQIICDVLNGKIRYPSDEQVLRTMDYLLELHFFAEQSGNSMMSFWTIQTWYSYSMIAQSRELKVNYISKYGTPEWIEH